MRGFSLVLAWHKNASNVYQMGINGGLPWPRITEDFREFARLTKGETPVYFPKRYEISKSAVVMGKNTFSGMGRVLPGRINIVINRDVTSPDLGGDVLFVQDLNSALRVCSGLGAHAFLIGGVKTYMEAMNKGLIHDVYLTEIETSSELVSDTDMPQGFPLAIQEGSNFKVYDSGAVDCSVPGYRLKFNYFYKGNFDDCTKCDGRSCGGYC